MQSALMVLEAYDLRISFSLTRNMRSFEAHFWGNIKLRLRANVLVCIEHHQSEHI